MTMIKYRNPLETEDFPAGLRVFQDTVARLLQDAGSARPWTPPVDIYETENELVLTADIPGMHMDDIEIQLENGTLTLKGERRVEQAGAKQGWHRVERSYGSFARTFTLPETVDAEKVQAQYRQGVLRVSLPKKELAKPRTIKVQVSEQ